MENIKKSLSEVCEEYRQRYYGEEERHVKGKFLSQPPTKRKSIDFKLEDVNLNMAKNLVRGAIYRHIDVRDKRYSNAGSPPLVERMLDGHVAPSREQVYRWLPSGLEEVKNFLKKRKVKNPEVRPEQRNTRDLSKDITAVYLMSYYHGKKLDQTLNELEFTIPLIAQRLIRLKY